MVGGRCRSHVGSIGRVCDSGGAVDASVQLLVLPLMNIGRLLLVLLLLLRLLLLQRPWVVFLQRV